MKSKSIGARCSYGQKEQLNKYCLAKGLTQSEVIRKAIENELKKK